MRFHSVVGNEISITIDAQQVAAMKSDKPSLLIARDKQEANLQSGDEQTHSGAFG
jgi:hypothetical protein